MLFRAAFLNRIVYGIFKNPKSGKMQFQPTTLNQIVSGDFVSQ